MLIIKYRTQTEYSKTLGYGLVPSDDWPLTKLLDTPPNNIHLILPLLCETSVFCWCLVGDGSVPPYAQRLHFGGTETSNSSVDFLLSSTIPIEAVHPDWCNLVNTLGTLDIYK